MLDSAIYRWKLYRHRTDPSKTVLAFRVLSVEEKETIDKYFLRYSKILYFVGDVVTLTNHGFAVYAHPQFYRDYNPA